jgi:hypothetical protein
MQATMQCLVCLRASTDLPLRQPGHSTGQTAPSSLSRRCNANQNKASRYARVTAACATVDSYSCHPVHVQVHPGAKTRVS